MCSWLFAMFVHKVCRKRNNLRVRSYLVKDIANMSSKELSCKKPSGVGYGPAWSPRNVLHFRCSVVQSWANFEVVSSFAHGGDKGLVLHSAILEFHDCDLCTQIFSPITKFTDVQPFITIPFACSNVWWCFDLQLIIWTQYNINIWFTAITITN